MKKGKNRPDKIQFDTTWLNLIIDFADEDHHA